MQLIITLSSSSSARLPLRYSLVYARSAVQSATCLVGHGLSGNVINPKIDQFVMCAVFGLVRKSRHHWGLGVYELLTYICIDHTRVCFCFLGIASDAIIVSTLELRHVATSSKKQQRLLNRPFHGRFQLILKKSPVYAPVFSNCVCECMHQPVT